MKKSNALMLSYIIFLAIALIASWFFDWEELSKIAMAATVSGLFFAFSDLINWYISHKQDYYDNMLKSLTSAIISIDVSKSFSKSCVSELREVLKLIEPYLDEEERLKTYHSYMKDSIKYHEDNIQEMSKLKDKAETKHKENINNAKVVDIYITVELTLVIAGFVLFFITAVFDTIFTLLSTFESSLTIIAFAVIMVTYFARDIIKNKDEKETEKEIAELEESNERIKKWTQEIDEGKRIKEIKAIVAKLEATNKTET